MFRRVDKNYLRVTIEDMVIRIIKVGDKDVFSVDWPGADRSCVAPPEFFSALRTMLDYYQGEARPAQEQLLLDALNSIAAHGDTGANKNLLATGSYSMFDEPSAVRTSREALSKYMEMTGNAPDRQNG